MYGNYGLDELVKFAELVAHGNFPATGVPQVTREAAQDVLKTFYANFQLPSKGNGDKCPVCGHKEGYNGWSNYETWEVALELSNSQYDDEACRDMVRDAGSVADGAKALKDYHESYIDECLESATIPFVSLYNTALSELDWYEIAASFKPDEWGDSDSAPEDDEDEDETDGDNYGGDMANHGEYDAD